MIRQKYQMPMQLSPFIITSTSVSPNNLRANFVITMPIKENKSQKAKIPGILSTKKAVVAIKYSAINNFIDNLANSVNSIFFESRKDQADYKNYAVAYY